MVMNLGQALVRCCFILRILGTRKIRDDIGDTSTDFLEKNKRFSVLKLKTKSLIDHIECRVRKYIWQGFFLNQI